MKKVLLTLSICIAAAAIISCNKEEIRQDGTQRNCIIEAVFETVQNPNEKTKVTFDQDNGTHTLSPKWEEGDEIIGIVNGEPMKISVLGIENGVASLSGLGVLKANDNVVLVYAPGITLENLDKENGKINVDLSKMVAGSPKGLNAIMYSNKTVADSEISEGIIRFVFSNKTSILEIDSMSEFQALSNNKTVSKIVVSGEEVFNSAVIDLETGVVTGNTRGEIVYTPGTPIAINSDGKLNMTDTLYAVMIPGTRTVDVCAKSEVNYFRSTIKETNYVASKCYYTNRKVGPIATFSISETEKVLFAPSNLVYTHPGKWGFFPKDATPYQQYARLRNTSGNIKNNTYADGDMVDLFSWSTESNIGGINALGTGSDVGENFYDWGKLVTGWDPIYWETLSIDEWNYLLSHNYRKIINDYDNKEKAIVIFPNQTPEGTYNSTTTIKQAVEAQCLILPAAGIRNKTSETTAKVEQGTSIPGLYHTSIYGGTVYAGGYNHYCDWQINSTKVDGSNNPQNNLNHQGSVADGISVRLAHKL